MTTLSAGDRGLVQQGYDYSPQQLKTLQWGLRFTPGMCMLGAVLGLYLQEPRLHLALAALGILPFWFPAKHPMDLLYNGAVRRLFGGVALPPNPLPRRIACLMGGAMNIFIAAAFFAGNPSLAYVFGGVLITLQLVVISTHFCLASWMWEGLMKALGSWETPLPAAEARDRVAQGAVLVDVRDPDEYAAGHIDGAVNVPSGQIEARADEFRGRESVLYCRSGLRSQEAIKTLRDRGCEQVYNLGAMKRWEN